VERDADGRFLVVTDSSFLINFLILDRAEILGRLRQFRFHALDHVVTEVSYREQRRRLETALEKGFLEPLEITDPDEILSYHGFRQFLGDGEAACLAVAASRRWLLAADEKGRFRRELLARLGEGYLLNTLGALLTAIRTGVITVSEAEALRTQLRDNRFKMDSTAFEELLREE
jgi:predicted nucleic acid-binding protein